MAIKKRGSYGLSRSRKATEVAFGAVKKTKARATVYIVHLPEVKINGFSIYRFEAASVGGKRRQVK